MIKHIREALRLAGLRQSDVTFTRSPNGHPHITVAATGKTVIASCSPRDPHAAARMLARDLMRALTQQTGVPV